MKKIENEPILEYKKGSKERTDLEKELSQMAKVGTLFTHSLLFSW